MSLFIEIVALALTLAAIYLCTVAPKEAQFMEGRKRMGCVIGILASPFNLYLSWQGSWAMAVITVVCFVIYVQGADLPVLLKKYKK